MRNEDDSASESSSDEMETADDSQQINPHKPPNSSSTTTPTISLPSSTPFHSTTPTISLPSSTTTPSTSLTPHPVATSTSLLASTSSRSLSSSSTTTTSPSTSSPGVVQALPIVLQTPAGIGYATTTDGSILGLLQGPNIAQPQFVAIPISNTENLSGAESSDSCSDVEMDAAPAPAPEASASPPPASKSQIMSPLVYQTPQGVVYAATPGAGGVILSLAPADAASNRAQFITIPLSMMAANGQGELDLSKRK
ncbi:unnamed protein product [Phyllotreta striolata]|uniref:Uncharacterized protein n=1 Tax=Phyllotreta striolata TaxID=444603 RepID=A0A9N9XMJ7_PHYSR|nr:unnamed protein product [Phyllotreta striolata]